MIKINLTSGKRSGNKSSSSGLFGSISTPSFSNSSTDSSVLDSGIPEEIRKEGLKRLLIVLLFPMALYAYEMQNLPSIRGEYGRKTRELSELQQFNAKAAGSVAEIKKFKEDEEKLQTRIAALEKLSRDRQKEIKLLDLIQQVTPDKAWLTRVEMSGVKLMITGLAYSDYDVSNLMEGLAKSAFLVDVNLVSSSEQLVDGANLKRFEISCMSEKSAP